MRLALVEDNPLLAQTFARMVAELPGHVLVALFASAEDALAGLQPGMVDLLIVDLDLPGLTGAELIARVRNMPWCLQSLVWTVYDGHDVVYCAIKAGAIGYLLKSMGLQDLERALDEIEQGGAPMSPRIARRLLNDVVESGEWLPPSRPLSIRERAVLRALAAGHSHKEIAGDMGISQHTVHTHLKRIYRKLHAAGRNEALERARQLGIVVKD